MKHPVTIHKGGVYRDVEGKIGATSCCHCDRMDIDLTNLSRRRKTECPQFLESGRDGSAHPLLNDHRHTTTAKATVIIRVGGIDV